MCKKLKREPLQLNWSAESHLRMYLRWTLWFACLSPVVLAGTQYSESLEIIPLPDSFLYSSFKFRSSATVDIGNHFDLLPRTLVQISRRTNTTSLHLRFGRGRWNQQVWGRLPDSGASFGGSGIEIWATIDSDRPEQDWTTLVNSLSGLFCASMNFIDSTKTIKPQSTFFNSGGELFYGVLPSETVCTENLTPFLKLLPCKGHAGISSLLSGHKLFDTDWSSLSVDLERAADGSIHVDQGVHLVFDVQRALSTARDPLPASQPSEEIVCADGKFYTSDVTCFPVDGRIIRNWSFARLFGKPLSNECVLSSEGQAGPQLLLHHSPEAIVVPHSANRSERLSPYRLENELLNLQFSDRIEPVAQPAPIEVRRTLTSQGSSLHGKLTLFVKNKTGREIDIMYLSILPWFMKPYLHTIQISRPAMITHTYYKPAQDRVRPTQLEIQVSIPADVEISITIEFERTVLRYAEYPPDANRGFDIP